MNMVNIMRRKVLKGNVNAQLLDYKEFTQF